MKKDISINNYLAIVRTRLANDRTLLAMVRTSAIFIGISLILANKEYKKISIAVLIFTVILTIGNSIISLIVSLKLHIKSKLNKSRLYLNMFYSLFLIIIIIILIIHIYNL